ncbi:MAG: SRPBCC family protein [Anaerolineae bacterium]
MIGICESAWLKARPERVWPFIVEPEEHMHWLTEMHSVEWLDDGPIRVGRRYHVDREVRGQVRRCSCEVTRLEENRLDAFTSEAPGFSHVEGVWELVPEGDGCRLTVRESIETHAGGADREAIRTTGRVASYEGFSGTPEAVARGPGCVMGPIVRLGGGGQLAGCYPFAYDAADSRG